MCASCSYKHIISVCGPIPERLRAHVSDDSWFEIPDGISMTYKLHKYSTFRIPLSCNVNTRA